MANIDVTKRTWTLDVDGTYILRTAIPDSDRPQVVTIKGTRVGGFDGTITLKSRPRGSTGAWNVQAYTVNSTGASAAATFSAADFYLTVDGSGKEFALDSTGRTTGSFTLDITDTVAA